MTGNTLTLMPSATASRSPTSDVEGCLPIVAAAACPLITGCQRRSAGKAAGRFSKQQVTLAHRKLDRWKRAAQISALPSRDRGDKPHKHRVFTVLGSLT